MNTQRPVNLNLLKFKFPLPAIISILHRLSGVFLFLLIPFLLWMLDRSLASVVGFDDMQAMLTGWFVKAVIWLFLTALIYHLIAGTRHLLMDIGIGESLAAGRLSAGITVGLSILCALLMGIWLW